jgi:hypothetical protein
MRSTSRTAAAARMTRPRLETHHADL